MTTRMVILLLKCSLDRAGYKFEAAQQLLNELVREKSGFNNKLAFPFYQDQSG